MEGVALAKKAKRYKGRAPAIRANNGKAELIERLHAGGTEVSAMARQVGVSRQTVYSWIKSLEEPGQAPGAEHSIFS